MSCIIKRPRKFRTLSMLTASAFLSVCLMVGTYAVTSVAETHGGHQSEGGHGVGHRGVGHQGGGHWGGGRGYGGGHYAAPPVIYGSPYCDTPPLLFIPFVGTNQRCY